MAPTQMMIVAGAAATVADLGKDESWLKDWLAEEPSRLGIGDITILPGEPVQGEDGNPAFMAADASRYYSVNVKLGALDASHGFHVLDSWARNRVRRPDKTHVAVLVTETLGDRYETALKALSEHLPLVVVELQAWRGKTESWSSPASPSRARISVSPSQRPSPRRTGRSASGTPRDPAFRPAALDRPSPTSPNRPPRTRRPPTRSAIRGSSRSATRPRSPRTARPSPRASGPERLGFRRDAEQPDRVDLVPSGHRGVDRHA